MINRGKKAVLGSAIMTAASMSCYMTLSNYLYPVSVAVGVDISKIALIFTFAAICNIVISLMLGKIMQRVSVRLLMSIGAICLIIFYTILAFTNSLTMVYAGAVVFGAASVLGAYGTTLTVVNWWADPKSLGRSMSSLTICTGVLTFISSPIVASMLQSHGRITALYQGGIMGAVMLLTAAFLIAEHPSKYQDQQTANASDISAVKPKIPGLSLGHIVRTAPFWVLMTGIILVNTATTGFSNNAAAFYQSFGVTAVQASLGISTYSASQLVWSYVYGLIVDKKGIGIAVPVCGAIGVAIYLVGSYLSGFIGVIIMASLISAICFGGNLGAMLFPKLYGGKEAGTLIGWANAAASVGAMLGAPIAASIYSSTGSLNLYLILAAGMVACAILITLYASSKKTVERMNTLQQ